MFIIWRNKTTNAVFTTFVVVPAGTSDPVAFAKAHAVQLEAGGGAFANCDFTIDNSSKTEADLRNSNQLYKSQRAQDDIRKQIASIEATITSRRLRDAVLGIDGGWLKNTEASIAALREQIKNSSSAAAPTKPAVPIGASATPEKSAGK